MHRQPVWQRLVRVWARRGRSVEDSHAHWYVACDRYEQQPYILHFLATSLPATGSATFLVCGTAPGSADSTVSTPDAASGDTVEVGNAQYELTFSTKSGMLVGAVSSMGTSPQPYALTQDIMQYAIVGVSCYYAACDQPVAPYISCIYLVTGTPATATAPQAQYLAATCSTP